MKKTYLDKRIIALDNGILDIETGKKKMPVHNARKTNLQYRDREYLFLDEVELLVESAGKVGHPCDQERNRWMIYFMFKHGLRVSELIRLAWNQIDTSRRLIKVNRLKSGTSSTHNLSIEQSQFLITRKRQNFMNYDLVFINHKTSKPFTSQGINWITKLAGKHAGLDHLKIHNHMMRHSCGFHLMDHEEANVRFIQSYLGHVKLESTSLYTQHSSKKFNGWFEDFDKKMA